ncbi:10576_t:CDS:2 [Funneliformis geosporum]|nr:10576_t:CDS:2 [Funneliformis geosporum]
MSESKGYEYFDRKSSTWNIIEFLSECNLEPFQKKIDCYLKCLDTIFKSERGVRKETAEKLLDQYKLASKLFLWLVGGETVAETPHCRVEGRNYFLWKSYYAITVETSFYSRRSLHNSLSGVAPTYLVDCHSRLIAEPQNWCQGASDLLGSLIFWWEKLNGKWSISDPKPDRKKARGWEEKRSRTQINIHQPINGNGNVIGNTDSTINVGTSVATSKRGLNREKQDEVTKRTKIESQDLPTDLSEEEREPPNLLSPPHYILISSGIEPDEDDSSDEEEGFCLDINTASFDDYLDQNKRDSEWKLLDGRQLVKALNSKTPKWLNYFWKKTKKSKPYLREVSSGLSSIIDLSFEDGMCSWFEKDWANIKKKVYEIVDMEPKGFEGEVENVINTIEEESDIY